LKFSPFKVVENKLSEDQALFVNSSLEPYPRDFLVIITLTFLFMWNLGKVSNFLFTSSCFSSFNPSLGHGHNKYKDYLLGLTEVAKLTRIRLSVSTLNRSRLKVKLDLLFTDIYVLDLLGMFKDSRVKWQFGL